MFSTNAISRMLKGSVAGSIAAVLLAACGAATPAATLPAAEPQAVQVAQAAAPTAAPAAPTVAPAPAAAPTAAPAAPAEQPAAGGLAGLDDALLAQGQALFEKDAGGVGCASCHGMDGKGNESIGAPDIQGRTEAQIRSALSGVDMMTIVKVKPDEVKALAAYLKHLSTQP